MRNRYYTLFTDKEIPHQITRVATNCFYAELYPCTNRMAEICAKGSPEYYKYCPRQTKAQFKHKGESK